MSEQEFRPTFTLRNLLWTITFLGIAIGLLLPGLNVQRNGVPRRAQCQNNLKQLALAMHNYESAFKHLPIGIQVVTGRNDTATTRAANWSWSVFLLPYVEQHAIHDMLDPRSDNSLSDRLVPGAYPAIRPAQRGMGGRTGAGTNAWSYEDVLTALSTPVSPFLCSSDLFKRAFDFPRSGVTDSNGSLVRFPGTGKLFDLGMSNYVVANSSGVCYGLMAGSANGEMIGDPPDGAFDAIRAKRLRDLRDGQSNIVLLGERVGLTSNRSQDTRAFGQVIPAGAGTIAGSRGIGNSSVDSAKTRVCANAWGAPDVMFSGWGGINSFDPSAPHRRFQGLSSRHSGGVNVARGDGSVEFITDAISAPASDSTVGPKSGEMGLWQQLIAINDGDLTLKNLEDF